MFGICACGCLAQVQTYKVHTVTQDAGSEGCASPMSTGGRGIPLARASLGFDSDGASIGERNTFTPG